MSIVELGAVGEFLGVFALVATLIYLSRQVRHARNESAHAVLEARATGIREMSMAAATSDGLSAAISKAFEATETRIVPKLDRLPSSTIPRAQPAALHPLDRQSSVLWDAWH